MDKSKKLSLRKKGWTDPETGEYYPGGNPNEISQNADNQNAGNSQSGFSSYHSSAFPEFDSVQNNSANEIYPDPSNIQSNKQQSKSQNNTQTGGQDPDLSVNVEYNDGKKFCKFCGKRILMDAVVCTYCGRQVELLKSEPEKPVVVSQTVVDANPRNRWISLILCILFGTLGIHRFYEGKFKTGLLWFFTGGLFTIGWLVDLVTFLSMNKNKYYIDNKGKRKELE